MCRRTSKAQGYAWCGDGSMFGLGAYSFLRVLLIRVPPLRRVTFSRRRKSNQKGFTLTFGPRLGSGPFAPGLIRGHRLRFASLHLLSMCLAAPNGRYAPTPGSIPPLSLPTGPEIKSFTRANAHCVEWGGMRRVRGVLVSSVGAAAGCDLLIWLLLSVGAGLPAMAAHAVTRLLCCV